ncbi:MAG TPA: hypothetical protein VNO52_11315 [Methylomirabilota bacterium]|nr:hypothetical protein [Methylomirabilota bacterium]
MIRLLVWAWGGLAASSPAALTCVSCRQTPKEPVFLFTSPALRDQVLVCQSCSQLTTACALCSIPLRTNFLRLDDGRFLCESHASRAVFSEPEALRIWEETKREMFRLFGGVGILPSRNISVSLVDGTRLAQFHRLQRSAHGKALTLGLTRTRQTGPGEFEHAIYLLNGLNRERLMAVCAHEYTHAWLHENVPAERDLAADTVEGFCELAAYHLMGQMGWDLEQRVILANNYTRGQIEALVLAAKDHDFSRITEWVKNGRDGSLTPGDPGRVLALNEPPPAPLFPWAPQPLPPLPDRLVLKGISGTARRRFALVNNRTLAPNEEALIRLGSSNVVVRCLDIRERSVLLSVNGSPQPVELVLSAR